jgi:hypothetical protein
MFVASKYEETNVFFSIFYEHFELFFFCVCIGNDVLDFLEFQKERKKKKLCHGVSYYTH